MARSPSDRGGRILTRGAFLAALQLALYPLDAAPAGVSGTFEIPQYSNMEINIPDDTMTVEDVVITHGEDTRVEAKFARQTRKAGNVKQLDLSGKVRIDFQGATLEAATAVMVFRGDQLESVQVDGDQADFSHQPEGLRRIFGRADSIRLETATGKLTFSGNTSYTDGCNRLASSRISYNMNEGTVTDDGHPATQGRATLCLDQDAMIEIQQYSNLVINVRDDTIQAEDVVLAHGPDTRVEAQLARQTDQADNVKQLDLSGGVHIAFRDTTLDATTASARFRGDQLLSVQVDGSQAQFSHQPEGYSRRVHGTADAIRYDTTSGKVVFSGNTAYTDGCNRLTSSSITYNINDGAATDDGDPATRGRAILCLDPDKAPEVPTPRIPGREQAR